MNYEALSYSTLKDASMVPIFRLLWSGCFRLNWGDYHNDDVRIIPGGRAMKQLRTGTGQGYGASNRTTVSNNWFLPTENRWLPDWKYDCIGIKWKRLPTSLYNTEPSSKLALWIRVTNEYLLSARKRLHAQVHIYSILTSRIFFWISWWLLAPRFHDSSGRWTMRCKVAAASVSGNVKATLRLLGLAFYNGTPFGAAACSGQWWVVHLP